MKKLLPAMVVLLLLFSSLSTYSFSLPGIRYKNKIFLGVDTSKDVVYGEAYYYGKKIKLKMDIYQPHGDRAAKRAVVICIHGGGFVGGGKSDRHIVSICKDLARRGYVTTSINYRLQNKSNMSYGIAITQAMHDAKAAVRFFRKYAEQLRIDTEKIAVLGGSAGAVTALYVAYLRETEYEGNSGNEGYSSNVSACVDLWGGLFKNVTEIDAGEPPVCIVHGTEDKVVPFSEAINITERCNETGVYYEFYPIKNEGHAPWNKMNYFYPLIVNFLYNKFVGAKANSFVYLILQQWLQHHHLLLRDLIQLSVRENLQMAHPLLHI